MALKIYKFIFLFLSFGLIESYNCFSSCVTCMTCPPAASNYQQIVLNEIMADPSPVVGLPDKEYLELYNPGNQSVNLKGWVLEIGGKQKILPDITIASDGFLLLVGTGGTAFFRNNGNSVEISGFLINNSGAVISLYFPDKSLADRLSYLPTMHRKGCEDGGYSLERIDPERLCGQAENWCTTLSEIGGTPGKANTVNASNLDHQPPVIENYNLFSRSRLEIQCSERIGNSMTESKLFRISSSDVVMDSIKYDALSKLITIWLKPSSIRSGIDYELIISGLKDECDNIMPDVTLKFGYFIPPKSAVLINEVLFNPFPYGTDFVEIYNNSGHEVDVSDLFLATRDVSHAVVQATRLSSKQLYLPDKAYLAISNSTADVEKFYFTKCHDCLLQTDKFPTYPDKAGTVVLLNNSMEVLDEMDYTETMHHPFISQPEGVSLERLKPELSSQDKNNWHSASESSGYATPGYQNSVHGVVDSVKSIVTINPEVFSPNGDGINDVINITIKPDEPGWLLNLIVLDSSGKEIRRLTNNLFLGAEEKICWDGLTNANALASPGIYILSVSLFNKSGSRKSLKLACVVSDHL